MCSVRSALQLALIFDLDETLVVAHTASTAEARRDDCFRVRCVGCQSCGGGSCGVLVKGLCVYVCVRVCVCVPFLLTYQ